MTLRRELHYTGSSSTAPREIMNLLHVLYSSMFSGKFCDAQAVHIAAVFAIQRQVERRPRGIDLQYDMIRTII